MACEVPYADSDVDRYLNLMVHYAKELQKKFGRGAFLIHFHSLEDYQAFKVLPLREVIQTVENFQIFEGLIRRKLFVINDHILWAPINLIDLYLPVKDDSKLRHYPLCVSFCVMHVNFTNLYERRGCYKCSISVSTKLHPSDSFEFRKVVIFGTI